jgi:glyoxylase-like metal-dependent hydrolase (beta-lactamase superfamily II)
MMNARKLGTFELFQVIEFSGPTHDADWMLPGIARAAWDANAEWLSPGFWMPRTSRLVFTMQLWVLKASDRVILIDTGVGNGKRRPAPNQNMINTPVIEWMEAIGAPPDRVTHVVHTHLHGDHVGWNTHDVDGRWEPTFPNAIYYLPRREWAHYKARYDSGERDLLGGSFADSIAPVAQAGLTRAFDDGDEIAECLLARAAPGHSPGQVTLTLRDGGSEYVFAGDVLHSPIQVLFPEANSRWCEFPELARSTRRALLHYAAETGATVFPAHAKGVHGWQIVAQDQGFAVRIPESSIQ